MRELLIAESASVKEAVASESERTRHELSTKIRELAIDGDNEAACNRLVRSVKYVTMNESFNQIVESHHETCEWILKDVSVPKH